jgi:uncharacterized protein
MTIDDRRSAPAWGQPIAPSSGRLQPLGLGQVELTGGFWQDLQALNATVIIDHAESWMERVGWIGNFDAALEGRLPTDRRGREFSDSDVYKLMEAMAWEIGRTGDPGLERRFQALVARVVPVQEPDGYLNTMFGRPGQGPRYSDLEWGHELYCFGHLIQAGVARARTEGSEDAFFGVALRAADHVCVEFGPDARDQVGGHPEIEVALAELGRLTGDRRYLDQARRFVERRGSGRLAEIEFGPEYFQDDLPVRAAEVLRGHAVRALYLAAGAVDVAIEQGDQELLEAVEAQLAATVARRTYLTGGMGARHEGESFGDDHQLPPDRSYSETCAGVASVMLAQRLLLATGDVAHADLIERVLYNVVATSPAEDGRGFFYTNTLHQRTPGTIPSTDRVSPRAAASLRAPWFAVSCCPTNVARLLASLGAYVATSDDGGVQLHQYVDANIASTTASGEPIALSVTTDYPYDGRVRIEVTDAPGDPWTLRLRVPAWATEGADLVVDGERVPVAPGYADVERRFESGDVVELELPVRARWTWADPRIDAVRSQVAVERGPLVYCMESTDLGADVASIRVLTDEPPLEEDGQVLIRLWREPADDGRWPYGRRRPAHRVGHEPRLVPLLPYHRWGNRGPCTMRVWLPVDDPDT